VVAENGNEALERIKQDVIDIVVSDVKNAGLHRHRTAETDPDDSLPTLFSY